MVEGRSLPIAAKGLFSVTADLAQNTGPGQSLPLWLADQSKYRKWGNCKVDRDRYERKPRCDRGSAFGCESAKPVPARINATSCLLPWCPVSPSEHAATFMGACLGFGDASFHLPCCRALAPGTVEEANSTWCPWTCCLWWKTTLPADGSSGSENTTEPGEAPEPTQEHRLTEW